jgi:hypothetical protein
MTNILVISPSGEIYDHDCVRWYPELGFARAPDHYHNIGDAFVFDSSLKLLDFDRIETLDIRAPSAREIDRYNAEFDFAFLRGSNYLHPLMDWENAPEVLARLRIPVLAFGIGAQAPAHGRLELPEAAKSVMRLIAERSVSMGVRGAYTADVLWSLGIRDARIVGCPTAFRARDPDLRIDLPPLETVRRVAYTLRREVGHDYAKDVAQYLSLQRETIIGLARRFDLLVCAQGEIEEKAVLWGDPAQKSAALATLRARNWLRGPDDPLESLYARALFYADDVSGFESRLRGMDLAIGYRLHGNLLALANRIPSIYFTYDSRTTEFADTFRIPSFDVFGGQSFRLEDFWEQARFEPFNRAFRERYRDMRLFLDENRIPHRMAAHFAAAAPAPAPAAAAPAAAAPAAARHAA